MWYAQNPGRLVRQLAGDGAVLLWIAVWAWIAVTIHRLSLPMAARAVEVYGTPRRGKATALPWVDERIGTELRKAAGAGVRFVGADDAPSAVLQVTATLSAAGLFLVATGLVLAWWLPKRLRWHRQAETARELAASTDGRELLALRSLMRPLDVVARTAATVPGASPGSLAEGWRDADPDTLDMLAEAELFRLGLRAV
ncbi:hypothetical protein [Streptomyces tsukubensis]|uniref:Uncharacterized protein n=1 Tax=Streptomyces tsukubensis TaxID=83656 RepID=A0A1V4ABW9_9ACTN|nr:hypothetical protein [Streptomyces tsukubensis]OON80789.1 hypothetical protein B1H18_10340 [Streptomyces tsukubensis]QFR93572.1 hypothetical protein GBW32_11325 [Streptomyces tsukubensis]